MSARCYVCGSPELIEGHDPRNAVCEKHRPARDHVIHMSRQGKDSIASCDCGWESRQPWRLREQQARLCRDHWEAVSMEMAS